MANQPYGRFRSEEMILRDYLAADDNSRANERTLLSYIRTALALNQSQGETRRVQAKIHVDSNLVLV